MLLRCRLVIFGNSPFEKSTRIWKTITKYLTVTLIGTSKFAHFSSGTGKGQTRQVNTKSKHLNPTLLTLKSHDLFLEN